MAQVDSRADAQTAGLRADHGWSELQIADSFADAARPWLQQTMRQTAATQGAVFLTGAEAGRPAAAIGPEAARLCQSAAVAALERGQPVAERPKDAPGSALIGQPLRIGSETVGAAVLRIEKTDPQRLRSTAKALAWGAAWLREAWLRDRQRGEARHSETLQSAHALFAAILEHPEARPAALEAVTRLAGLTGADRVALGFRRRGRSEIFAISHSAEFGRRLSLNRSVVAAMDEAIDQRAVLSHPAPADEVNATRAHRELSRDHGPSTVLTVPFWVRDDYIGAITVERAPERRFTEAETVMVDFIASLAGPVLWERRQNDRWLPAKAADTAVRQLGRLLGPGYLVRKLVVAVTAALVALFATWNGPYRVSADAGVEGIIERSVVAPFDGFLREAPVRAGDAVAEGDLLAALDDRDLVLERLRWHSEREQKSLEYGQALGAGNRAQAQIIQTQIAQAEAQMELLDAQLERAQLTAPFDGLVVAGDLSQQIGGSVTRGDVLFQVAPAGDYRVVLEVDEARIADVTAGAAGDLVVAALPETRFPIAIDRITPVAEARDGRNTIAVEAVLTGATDGLSPGMRGVAKIDVDERLMIRIWTREMLDWARLRLWAWFG